MRQRNALGRARGFTLVEVMLALAILGMALVMLMRSAASSLFATSQAQMLGVVTDLARGKMYDLEEKLLKDGFSDTEQTLEGTFEAEGWESVEWKATIEPVDLPSFQTMKEVGTAAAQDGGRALGERVGVKQPGAGSAGQTEQPQNATGNFIEQFYGPIAEILKISVRRVSLEMKWKVLGKDRDFKVIMYVTDPSKAKAVVDSVMSMLGGSGGEEGEGGGAPGGGAPGGGAPGGGAPGGGEEGRK